jgi:light-regulated signal transduction histidine kinase (bacteriophytochrome)
MTTMNLTDCDREPIHIIGRIQSFAVLLEFSDAGELLTYSANVPDILEIDPAELPKCRADFLFADKSWKLVVAAASGLSSAEQIERVFHIEGFLPNRLADVNVSRSTRGIVVEIEECIAGIETDFMPQVRHITMDLDPRSGVETLAHDGAEYVRELTGFDRVMVYKFHADGSGEVIAEARGSGIDSFLGLRYPATDIPQQARALYQRNLIRSIADVDAETVELLSTGHQGQSAPLDLSMCVSRAISPIHTQYLKNMGVRASMSISIMDIDGLWGLIACHNINGPLHVSHPKRSAAELFGQIFSYKISESRTLELRQLTARAQMVHSQITARFASTNTVFERFDEIGDLIASVIPCDGVIAKIGGEFLRYGKAPDELTSGAILDFMKERDQTEVFATDRLSDHLANADELKDVAAGILVIPISRLPEDYLILCRAEVAKSVRWAGNPDKPAIAVEGNPRLTPRESFAEWRETVRGYSDEWTEREIALAEALRATFVEVLFKLTEQNAREKDRANKKQKLLINELNHRVRNIITLIASLIEQSAENQTEIDQYKATLEGRISALSTAHDMMTSEEVSAISLKNLIASEMAPYEGREPGKRRLKFNGPDIFVALDSIPILALVIHELVTNAVKYGSLSNETGYVNISTTLLDDGGFTIDWVEAGGPPLPDVSKPGTGTTLIEEAVPFQLSGSVDIQPRTSGMEVCLRLPRKIVRSTERAQSQVSDSNPVQDSSPVGERHFLILEDEFLIAKTEKKMLLNLGADRVTMTANCADALTALKTSPVDFALLDINLRDETSIAAANWLLDAGVPFVFASGYGSEPMLESKFAQVPRITKPFTMTQLRDVMPLHLLPAN